MTPETKARQEIDQRLTQAGWVVQDMKELNLAAGVGVAIREYPTDSGPADYVLFVKGKPVGVIEAKRNDAAATLTMVEQQTGRYAVSRLKWLKDHPPLPFLFEATGKVIRFTEGRDPFPRSRELFHFFKPETLADWVDENGQGSDTLRKRLLQDMPALDTQDLRECQIKAITGLEASLAENRPRALIHMATGAGKTFTAITAAWRLLKYGGARRILFLVDTRNLGKQAHQEFMAYSPPGRSSKFIEIYNVQQLTSNKIDAAAKVCICTIQRMYSILTGEPIDDTAEDISLNEVQQTAMQRKLVQYNPAVPNESFDFIIIDECHRSIYNLWKQVLDYFDAFLIGLTATPDKRTFGFFNENIVAEYTYEQSVADLVNVGYDAYEITTEITQKGSRLVMKEWVDHRDRKTRKKRWAELEDDTPYTGKELEDDTPYTGKELEDDTPYTGKELDRSMVNPSQIRSVLKEMKHSVETKIFPDRKETPKTLIFAKTDSHADDIIQMVREVYAQGNAFCKKVTYKAEEDPDSILSNFRNEYNPRIVVTVDMIATGTDVKPLEILLFMRDVRSKGYYEQMKGRGVRSLDASGLQRVSSSAQGAKSRFVLIDAVGVEKSCKTETRPLEKKPGVALKDLLQGIAIGSRDDDTVLSLANRLVRLAKLLDQKAQQRIEKISGGVSVGQLGKNLIGAVDPDKIVQDALAVARAKNPEFKEDLLSERDLQAARAARVAAACAPFNVPELRDEIESARREREQIIDHVNLDQVTFSGFSAQAEAQAAKVIQSFGEYIAANKDEIAALSFFYQQPYQRRALTFEMIEQLHEAMSRPPLLLTTEKLWNAYARVQGSKVKGANIQRQLTDLVSLVRFAAGMETELKPFGEQVDKRFQTWIFRHNAQRTTAFTAEQTEWLRMMKDHIATSCCIVRDDFGYAEFANKGGLQRVWGVFGKELDALMNEMNEELVA
jgi:type I restriction enzyme, R subunit